MANTRRRFLFLLMVVVFVGGGWWFSDPDPETSSTDDDRTPVEAAVPVAPNLYLVPGGGGNTAVFVMRAGVLLVDPKYAVSWPGLLEQVRTITDKPITHVINTHSHGDHAGANTQLPDDVEVIAHENTMARLEADGLLPTPANEMPPRTRSFRDRLVLFDGEDEVELYGLQPAHTDGDLFVIFRRARVMHTGDVLPDRVAPVINLEAGGNGVLFPQELARAAATITGVDRLITGHGPVLEWAALAEYAEFTQTMVDYVRAEMRFGRDKQRVFKAFSPPGRFAAYNLDRSFGTLDEIDRTIRPRWQRIW